MALTGKTIGQLTYLQYPTNDTLIPVELSGDSFHIAFSAVNYTEVTYSDLNAGLQLGELSPGHYYLITDFQTIYDQPNWDENGGAITTGNNKSGTTEPLLVLAISTSQLAPTAYSTLYPTDKITYDVTWYQTEVTNTPAKGRITERIDTVKNNRTDYDFRAVQFIRYHGFFSETLYDGKVSIDNTGLVTGVGTFFTSTFAPGSIIGIKTANAPISCFVYYEVSGVTNDTSMVVVGKNIISQTDTYYAFGYNLPTHSSPFQCNITGDTYTGFTEYYTFNNDNNFNTYIGNNTNYFTFLLSNNVFKGGSYRDNTFGGNSVGNTFDDDMDSNTCGPDFSYNIITNDFDDNTIGPSFSYNIIDCDFQNNIIGDLFEHNMIGDEDANDFNDNRIGSSFNYNYITIRGGFENNNIGAFFYDNIINDTFDGNTLAGNFNNNFHRNGSFNYNTINHTFYNNQIHSDFLNNQIDSIFNSNYMYSIFQQNTIAKNSYGNSFGDPASPGATTFGQNNIGSNFQSNYFSGNTLSNVIGDNCNNNNLGNTIYYNRIGDYFGFNTIGNNFGYDGVNPRGNIVGGGFNNNTVGNQCYDNTFGDNCYQNTFGEYFINNKLSRSFNNVTTGDLDTAGNFQNNSFAYGGFNTNLTLSGGTGGNPVFYTNIPTNVTLDYADASGYVTFLSGGTIIAQTLTV